MTSISFGIPGDREAASCTTHAENAQGEKGAALGPILRSLPSPEVWARLAPAFVLDEPVQAKPESEVLAFGRIQSITTTDPLFISRRVNRAKSLALTCYGLWRWKTYAEGVPGSERLLENLVSSSVRWLVSSDDEKPVQVRPSKETFTGSEPVAFTAQVYDENYRPVDDAKVSLSVTQQGQTSQLTLTSLGNGRFEGAFDPLPEGVYKKTKFHLPFAQPLCTKSTKHRHRFSFRFQFR